MTSLTLGTRGSQLALWQANTVASLLERHAHVHCAISIIRTSGDRLSEANLSDIGGKRLFVKEIEDALLSGAVDLAVHSSKDMPAVLPEGLAIGAVLPREDPRDVVILPQRTARRLDTLEELIVHLGRAPKIGTSSVRRIAQLIRLFPGARFEAIRGNLDTRLRKLDAGDYDAIVLAAAGMIRLGFGGRISASLPVSACIPAPGQGIVAVEVRAGDTRVADLVATITDAAAGAALEAERAVVAALGGGCQMPVGAYAQPIAGDRLELHGLVVSLDGARAVRSDASGAAAGAAALGVRVGRQLMDEGAMDILDEVTRAQAATRGLQP